MEEDKSLETLVKMAYDENAIIRMHAAEELGKKDDELAYQVLLELSNDKDENVREAAKKSIEIFKARYKKANPEIASPLLSTINQLISKSQESSSKQEDHNIILEPDNKQESLNIFDYFYNSLDRYREQPQIMKKHYENLKNYLLKELELIYQLIENEDAFDITKIRNKMKIINTGELKIKNKELKEFVEKKNKKKIRMYRFVVEDKYGREGVVYLDQERGEKIEIGDVIKILNSEARNIKGTDETSIWVWGEDSLVWKKV